MKIQTCSRCGEVKDADLFYPRDAKGTPQSACKPCMKVRATLWAKAHPERRRQILRRYGAKRRARAG